MERIKIQNPFEGYVRVLKEGNELTVKYPDNSTETIEYKSDRYNRYFDKICEMMGIAKKDNDDYFLTLVPYVMLHNHGEHSLLDGLSQPKGIAKKLNSEDAVYTPCFALTDHGLPSGLPAFDSILRKNGLCPINGVEVYADNMEGTDKNFHLILIAKNQTGFINLSHICTEAQSNFYRHANVTLEMLKNHSEGLICLTACIGGELPQYILNNEFEKAEEFIRTYKEIFKDDFYLEIQNHHLTEEAKVRYMIYKLAEKYNVKIVATTDSHYINKSDSYAHEILLAIGTKRTMSDPERFVFEGDGYHILNADEFYDLFEDHPESIYNAFEIVEKCQFHFEKREIEMPYFEIPEGYDEAAYFDYLTKQGFDKRFNGRPEHSSQEYKERLDYELSIIHQMGFEGYLLIVQDFINWAKRNGIAVGPGRGSAVGSLVSYCLAITDLDPIPYGLLFERFLNPERVSMPKHWAFNVNSITQRCA